MSIESRLELHLDRLDLAIDLDVGAGEVVAVLGPNGAGKTTVLRCLAGLEPLHAGSIAIAGQLVDEPATATFRPPEQRSVGMVFQDHLLFPHLSAVDNVAFGLRARGSSRAEASVTARQWLERVGVADMSGARSGEVSGGQAQRIALARALAPDPQVLLLDEPFAALDAGTRAAVRRDLRDHLADFSGATVLVTHDPLDALALADRLVIVEGGAVTQAGPTSEVTSRPRSSYVADLVGVNLLPGVAHGAVVDLIGRGGQVLVADQVEGPVLVLIRPHSVSLHLERPEGSARNRWEGEIRSIDLMGDRMRVRVEGQVALVAEVTPSAVAEMDLVEGTVVWATTKATEVETYPR